MDYEQSWRPETSTATRMQAFAGTVSGVTEFHRRNLEQRPATRHFNNNLERARTRKPRQTQKTSMALKLKSKN
ncbi:hypothetical protein A4A49_63074 [Nicotiana attenuata]|uniref:Uncharacterized protein n=1 Tax=Nicotiana attenuata TaxID=49451 RepID=A0A1J6IQ41_NICAT|nr:hypothetical protein A4A49_63074 [Nicotiana attenuata]